LIVAGIVSGLSVFAAFRANCTSVRRKKSFMRAAKPGP